MSTANSSPNNDTQTSRPPSRAQEMQTEYTDRYPPLDDLRQPDQTDRNPPLFDLRPPDRTDEYPLFEDTRALKQARTTEKSRATRQGNKIINHVRNKKSRTELKFMRTEFSTTIADCLSIHQQYCDSKEEEDERDDEWVKELGEDAESIFEIIDRYLERTSRPPSAVSIGHASQRSLGIQSNATVYPAQPDPPNRPADHHSVSPSSSVSNQDAKALLEERRQREEERRQREEEKRQREQLEKQIQQMKIDEKEKIKKAVEEERERQSSKYTTANQEAVNEAEKRANEIAEENKKIRTALEVQKQKQKELFEAAQEKDRLLRLEKKERRESEQKLNQKIQEQQSKIPVSSLLKQPYTSFKPTQFEPTRGANPFDNLFQTASNPNRQTEEEPINFKQWTAHNDNLLSSTKDSTESNHNTRSVFRLPKLDLKPYDGDPKKWPDFIAIFRDLVHSNNSLSSTEKMALLKRSLSEDIRNGLGDSLSSSALYSEALTELENTYGHPQIVSRAYIQSLIELPKVNNNDYKTLLKFSQTLNGAVSSLKNGGYEHELKASGILELILAKLPAELQSRWGKKIVKSHPVCLTLQDFSSWIHLIVKGEMMAKHCLISPASSPPSSKSNQKPGRQQTDRKPKHPPSINIIGHKPAAPPSTAAKQNDGSKTLTCLLCRGDHRLSSCPKFAALSLEERMKIIKEFNCCLRCLTKGHWTKECFNKTKCNFEECTAHHHPLLHGAPSLNVSFKDKAKTPKEEKSETQENKKTTKKGVGTHTVEGDSITTLLLTVPVIIEANGIQVNTVGILDQGSQASLILEKISKKLKLNGPTQSSPLATFHGNDPKNIVKCVSFNILTTDSSRSFEVKSAYTVPRLQIQTTSLNWPAVKHQWNHLCDIEPINADTKEIGVLLGRDVLRVHDVLDSRYPADGVEAPDGIKTHFGWCVTGPVATATLHPPLHINALSITQQLSDQALHDVVNQFWLTESFGVRPSTSLPSSLDDKAALKILEQTTRHTGERYEVGLMLRDPKINIPNNREVAVRHFNSLEKRFARDPAFAERYSRVMNEYISLGHAVLLDVNNSIRKGFTWYLPHHGVTNPNKPEKVRVVFNPSARYKGTSLNEQLFKGPDLLTCLIGVLLRFRQFPVPISGDIEKMYHQVLVPKQQQSLFRFLWKNPGDVGEPKEYQMTVHVFGAVSSPTSCIYALRKTAEDFGSRFPDVADSVSKNIYVDNYLDSTETEEEAIAKLRDVSALLKLGGFNMVQWLSSSRSVLATVDHSDLSRSLDLDADKLPIERTLGLLWNCQQDSFNFKSSIKIQAKTKREVLQEVASVFDPLGFLSPVVMTAKILLQEIWRSGADWDDPLPPTLLEIWMAWAKELSAIASIKIPRCFRLQEKPISYELHVCSDASEVGFGACVYLRAEYPNGHFRLNLLLAKARVAPLRQLSIPRLELQGAVLGVRLCDSAIKELGPIAAQVIYWCDSQTVLQWIHSKSCKYHAFVAHRITEIVESSAASQWRHIPGELNPADDCSRGIPATHLTTQHRWFRGPDFLALPQSSWPSTGVIDEPSSDDPEVSPAKWVGFVQVTNDHPVFNLIQQSSNLHKLKRIVAWLLRFVNNRHINPKNRQLAPYVKAPELREALRFIIRVDQRHFFDDEFRCLTKGRPVPTASSLANLTPFLDPFGIIRVGGRLQHASLPEDTKHPIVLSSDSQLSTMVITDTHKLLIHASTEPTLHALRAKYHVLHPRASINRVIRKCFTCKLRNSQPAPPLMGPLPASRLQTHLPAFTNVGIDLFGPFSVVILRRSVKRYGVMFTCLDTRAVHLEVADSLDMDSFINAFSRFADRRGVPQLCYSDNGTNLVAGEQEINRALSRWNEAELVQKIEKLKNQPIEWRFSPPVAPHFGGSWERLIKSAKTALRGILNNRSVTEDVLVTAIVGAEALLNSRPLTHVSVNPNDLEAITPNHFLLLRAHPGCNLDSPPDTKISSRRRYEQAQELITHFWNRWLREYVPNGIERRKWLRSRRNLAVNDLVLVVTPNSPRGSWPIGRVVSVQQGPDGFVRSADVRVVRAIPSTSKRRRSASDVTCTTHLYTRSVHKLCLLEEDEQDVSEDGNRAGNVQDV